MVSVSEVAILQREQNQQRGYEAHLKSIILLANDGTLPLTEPLEGSGAERKRRVYLHGIDASIAGQYADVVATPQEADVAILRVEAVEGGFRPGAEQADVSITFPEQTMVLIQGVAATDLPTVVAVNLGSTLAVLPQALLDGTQALLMVFDVLDNALLERRVRPLQPRRQAAVRRALLDGGGAQPACGCAVRHGEPALPTAGRGRAEHQAAERARREVPIEAPSSYRRSVGTDGSRAATGASTGGMVPGARARRSKHGHGNTQDRIT